MKVFAVYENDKLMALCLERVAVGTLRAELYYDFRDSTVDCREVEMPDVMWQMFESKRETYPEGY